MILNTIVGAQVDRSEHNLTLSIDPNEPPSEPPSVPFDAKLCAATIEKQTKLLQSLGTFYISMSACGYLNLSIDLQNCIEKHRKHLRI